jgi:sugar-specific transcriptional regulator TrmB
MEDKMADTTTLEVLQRLGLDAAERNAYLACLRHADGLFAYQIADESKIKRTTADLVLQRLISKGFISRGRQGKRFKYFAEPPNVLLFKHERLVQDFRDLLPHLLAMKDKETRTEIRFFNGRDGIRQFNDDILTTMHAHPNEEQLTISSGTHFTRIITDTQRSIIKRRLKVGYGIRIIAPSKAREVQGWAPDAMEKRKVRYFDEQKFPFNSSVDIYADKVAVHSLVKPINGVIIRNAQIARSLRSIYELLWSLLKE